MLRDARGVLSFAEEGAHIPFTPRRYFTIAEVPAGGVRGDHAHRECHQFFVCLRGACTLRTEDVSGAVTALRLDSAATGIHAPPMTWCTLHDFSSDALLLILASDVYSADDYVHDREEFLRLAAAR